MTDAATASGRLRAKLDLVLPEVGARTQLIASHEQPRETYAELVRLLLSVIRASVPLLVTAERASAERAADDPVAAGIVEYLRDHAVEKRHHDEWLLEDYAAMGGDPAELIGQPG
jgi:hypothetical protein